MADNIRNEHISSVLLQDDESGPKFVDPSFHTKAPLHEDSAPGALLFQKKIGKTDRAYNIPNAGIGSTPKAHFIIGGERKGKKMLPSRTFMVKPYFEDRRGWKPEAAYPISGWAEMAFHDMQHAAGLGHTAMKIHTYGHAYDEETTPALAIELEPNTHRVGMLTSHTPNDVMFQNKLHHISDEQLHDIAKIGVLDFLSNNQDRHAGNLLFRKNRNAIDSFLAIDNGLAFQYLSPNRFADTGRGSDHFNHYFHKSSGIKTLFKPSSLNVLPNWWGQYREKIIESVYHNLKAIKNPRLQKHMMTSFDRRVKALDDIVKHIKISGVSAYATRSAEFLHPRYKKAYAAGSVRMNKGPSYGH